MRPIPIIPPGTFRCPSSRQVPCMRAEACARAMIPHAKGLQVRDYSTEPRPDGRCNFFVALTPASAVVPESVVHETPQGLA